MAVFIVFGFAFYRADNKTQLSDHERCRLVRDFENTHIYIFILTRQFYDIFGGMVMPWWHESSSKSPFFNFLKLCAFEKWVSRDHQRTTSKLICICMCIWMWKVEIRMKTIIDSDREIIHCVIQVEMIWSFLWWTIFQTDFDDW